MSNPFYIFITSKNLELHMNIITHAVNYLGADSLIFIHLTHYPTIADFSVEEYVNSSLNSLVIQRKELYPKTYSSLYRIFMYEKKVMNLDYSILKKSLKLFKGMKNENPIFDLSNLPKRACLDIFIKLISVGIEYVVVFELKNTDKKSTLYHDLQPEDFKVIKVIDEETFLYTLEAYTQKNNRDKMIVVLISILISSCIFFLSPPTDLSTNNIVVIFLGIVSGIIPFLELVGVLDIASFIKRLIGNKDNIKKME